MHYHLSDDRKRFRFGDGRAPINGHSASPEVGRTRVEHRHQPFGQMHGIHRIQLRRRLILAKIHRIGRGMEMWTIVAGQTSPKIKSSYFGQ